MECGRCGRALKDKKSFERGYGPKCWKKAQADEKETEQEGETPQHGENEGV
ncbi:DUF6011 domain-containing protein [Thalassobacillus sp. C254]|uniref:DUF6011 domain-containing protein n=1 Tax=Thalassobacillus sp. C254 TaxID=1225341 RepID=UPI0012EE1AC7